MKPHPLPAGPGQESVWSYPRPPRLEPTPRRIRVVHRGVVVADARRALRLLETSHPPTYYLPPDEVRRDLLVAAPGGSFCEWKGQAVYWSVQVAGELIATCAWSYPDPTRGFSALRDHVAFYARPFDECLVDDVRATPQPGGFYGGWVTPDLVGPFKGEPGTHGW
ncbi:MAG: DUF427 domain-containing protein [Myxococcales bacterium]|nr:MAG: DUF427 domain-containing protein [Myxococcales bacterium]